MPPIYGSGNPISSVLGAFRPGDGHRRLQASVRGNGWRRSQGKSHDRLGVTVTAISELDSAVKISAGGREWVFLTKTAKSQFVSKNSDISPAPRRPYRGLPPRDRPIPGGRLHRRYPGSCKGPVEAHTLPACRVRSLDRVGPLVILPVLGALEQF